MNASVVESVVVPVVAPEKEELWFSSINPVYLSGGNAELIIRRKSDGKKHAYRVRRVEANKGVFHFVDYLSEGGWHYIGVFNFDAKHASETLIVTKNSKFSLDSVPVKVFHHFMIQLLFGYDLPDNYEVSHGKSCSCCGRALKTEESLHNGIGPVCKVKVAESISKEKK